VNYKLSIYKGSFGKLGVGLGRQHWTSGLVAVPSHDGLSLDLNHLLYW
jgi:hypothetical protein